MGERLAEWRAQQAQEAQQVPPETTEDVNTLDDTKGREILDSGVAIMCS